MAQFGWHKRNHSFPPTPRYVQKPSKALGPPLPDIDDEPWMHFLSDPDEDGDEYADYLHFDAGILAGSDTNKHKPQKFKPHRSTDVVRHHHGYFSRRANHHGWSTDGSYFYDASTTSLNPGSKTTPVAVPRPRRHPRRTLSGHRHSWQEPSLDLFTLDEEIPQIIVSDFDAPSDEAPELSSSPSSSTLSSESDTKSHDDEYMAHDDAVSVFSEDGAHSPRLLASLPADKPDVALGKMWFAEKARL